MSGSVASFGRADQGESTVYVEPILNSLTQRVTEWDMGESLWPWTEEAEHAVQVCQLPYSDEGKMMAAISLVCEGFIIIDLIDSLMDSVEKKFLPVSSNGPVNTTD